MVVMSAGLDLAATSAMGVASRSDRSARRSLTDAPLTRASFVVVKRLPATAMMGRNE